MTEYEVPTEPRRSRLRLVLGLFVAATVIAALAYGGWWLWQARSHTEEVVAAQDTLLRRLNRQLSDAQAEIRQLEERQADGGNNLRRTIDDVAALQSRIDDAEAALGRINATLQGGRSRAQLVAVEQLLLIANERAQLAHDIPGTLDALALAQERLGALAEPKLYQIRQALAQEKDAVAALPRIDLTGAALTLADLIERAPQLSLRSRAPQHLAAAATAQNQQAAEGGWLARSWRNLREALGAILIIRRSDKPVDRLLPVEQEGLIVQLLLLKLESTRTALLLQDSVSLKSAANDARRFLADYYRNEDPAVQAIEAELDRLAATELAPKLPDLSRSLGLLRAYLDANPR